MNPYQQLAAEYARFAREGRNYPLGRFSRCPRPHVLQDAPKVLIFSPHPDDEVITGVLPLRLLRKSRWNVINIAVTLGSRTERRAERLEELKGCCDCIGFTLEQTAGGGLERIDPQTRSQDPAHWTQSVQVIAAILARHQPRVILFPHEADANRTHVGTHFLLVDALKTLPADFRCWVAETEYWAPMAVPNFMLEASAQEVADLMTALSFHAGEVRRNPYHLALAGWMVDNVRRGSELVGTAGGIAPAFAFATLYRVRRWAGGQFEEIFAGGKILDSGRDPAELFPL